MRSAFIESLIHRQHDFAIDLDEQQRERFADYYDLIQEHNPLLHLVGPCSPEEFAVRHILESLSLLKHLPPTARIADVGTGAGLPSIPCLLARDGLSALLVESKLKKVSFLHEAVSRLKLSERAVVIGRQFEEADAGDTGYVTCRALDKFTAKLPRLLKWSGRRTLLLFGGPALGEALLRLVSISAEELMPMSDQRYLFVVRHSAS